MTAIVPRGRGGFTLTSQETPGFGSCGRGGFTVREGVNVGGEHGAERSAGVRLLRLESDYRSLAALTGPEF